MTEREQGIQWTLVHDRKRVRHQVDLSEVPALNEVPCNIACRFAKHRTMNVVPRQSWRNRAIYHICTHRNKQLAEPTFPTARNAIMFLPSTSDM